MADGFSSMDPRLARGRQESARQATARRSRKGRSSSSSSSAPKVSIRGDQVFINGQGFSVAPDLQASFIRRKTGGSGSSAQAAIATAANLAKVRAEEARKAQAQKAAEKKAAAEMARQEAVSKLISERTNRRAAQAEKNRILQERARLIRKGVNEQKTASKDFRTNDRLIVSQWRDRDGTRVQRTENLTKGTTTYKSFAPIKKGGRVNLTGGVIVSSIPISKAGKPTAAEIAAKVKIRPSSNPNKVIVTFPNGQTGLIGTTGKAVVGKALAGHQYLFEKGVIIAVDGKSTFAREEFVSEPSVKAITKPTGNVNKIINKLNVLQKKTSTSSIRSQQNKLKNELSLLGLTTATTIIGGAKGVVALGKGTIKLIRNPKEIKKLPGVLKSIPGAVSEAGKSFGKLIIVSPTEAIGVIAGEYILFKGAGATFKATGKLSSKTVKLVKPAIRKADRVAIKITGKTINIAKKSKVISKAIARGKKVKKIQKAEIGKFKSAVEVSNQLKRAKIARKAARKKGIKTVSFGNDEYIKAVDFMEEFSDNYAKIMAKRYLKKWKASGRKIGLGQEEEFISKVQVYLKGQLNEMPSFKRLKEAARINKPFTARLIKAKKIKTSKVMFNQAKGLLTKKPLAKKMNSIVRRVKVTTKKVSPKTIKKKAVRAKQVRAGRKAFKKTNRYRMEKSRKIRKVSIEKLNRDQSINSARKYVDDLFDEIALRQKVKMDSLEYRQFKNVIKKRFTKAIRTGDKAEIARFKETFRNIIRETNKPSKAPTVKLIEKKTKRIQTIKDFQPEAPRGQYVEVKSGQQVLLQKVKQVQKAKQVQKQVQKQVFVIVSVQKQSVNLVPLLKQAIVSLTVAATLTQQKQKTKQKQTTKQLLNQSPAVAQDFKVLQKVAQAIAPALSFRQSVAQVSAQAKATAQKSKQKLKPRTVQAKKKPTVVSKRLPKKFKKKTISKPQAVYYIKVKKKGKMVNLTPRPLILRDARDYLAYSIDNNLTRQAYFEPIGRAKNVVRLPKQLIGYYERNKQKLRPFKIKAGRKKQLRNGYIEKRKYIADTAREKSQLARSKKKASSKKTVKRTPVRKAPVKRKTQVKRSKTASRKPSKQRKTTRQQVARRAVVVKKQMSKKKRKMTPAQRKVMLKNLKKARAARGKKK